MSSQDNVAANEKYKDSLFRFLFGNDKKISLELYNAVNGTIYTNIDDLEINTLQDVIYMKMKNDLSFIFGSVLNLYEHQSTVNPNMPLRGLMYISELYDQIYGDDPKIYSRTLLKIPTPKYVVFYNGDDNKWTDERIKLRLSDAFDIPLSNDERGDYEWTATVININKGKNEAIKNRSITLNHYCQFVELVKKYSKDIPFDEAVDKAVQECIDNGILADFLMKHRKEVKLMCLTEFNEQKYTEMVRDEGKAESLIKCVKGFASKHNVSIEEACEEMDIEFSEYEEAQKLMLVDA